MSVWYCVQQLELTQKADIQCVLTKKKKNPEEQESVKYRVQKLERTRKAKAQSVKEEEEKPARLSIGREDTLRAAQNSEERARNFRDSREKLSKEIDRKKIMDLYSPEKRIANDKIERKKSRDAEFAKLPTEWQPGEYVARKNRLDLVVANPSQPPHPSILSYLDLILRPSLPIIPLESSEVVKLKEERKVDRSSKPPLENEVNGDLVHDDSESPKTSLENKKEKKFTRKRATKNRTFDSRIRSLSRNGVQKNHFKDEKEVESSAKKERSKNEEENDKKPPLPTTGVRNFLENRKKEKNYQKSWWR